jgi:hypothetical protein
MEGAEFERGARNPWIHAAAKYPAVENNAAWSREKSMGKTRISTVFLGFCAIFAEFRRFLGRQSVPRRDWSGFSARVCSCA